MLEAVDELLIELLGAFEDMGCFFLREDW